MALLKNIPLKWQLGLGLFTSVLTAVTAYTLLAKSTFESDKIAHTLESQQSRLESAKNEISSKFERLFLSARSVVATYDYTQGKPSAGGTKIFTDEKGLLALELWSEIKNESLIRLEKKSSLIPPFSLAYIDPPLQKMNLRPLDSEHYLLTLRYRNGDHDILKLRMVFHTKNILPAVSTTQSVALAQGEHIVALSDIRGIGQQAFKELIKADSQVTGSWHHQNHTFLVNQIPLGLGDFKLYSMTPKAEALGALEVFFNRSIIFIVLGAFLMAFVAALVAQQMQKKSKNVLISVSPKTAQALADLILPLNMLPEIQENPSIIHPKSQNSWAADPYFKSQYSVWSEEEL